MIPLKKSQERMLVTMLDNPNCYGTICRLYIKSNRLRIQTVIDQLRYDTGDKVILNYLRMEYLDVKNTSGIFKLINN